MYIRALTESTNQQACILDSVKACLRSIKALIKALLDSVKALLTLYYGSFKALLRHCKALLRLFKGSIKARLLRDSVRVPAGPPARSSGQAGECVLSASSSSCPFKHIYM
jgi:hypothetical protein